MHGHNHPPDYDVVKWLGSTIPCYVGPIEAFTTRSLLKLLIMNTGRRESFFQDAKGRPVENLSKPLVPGMPYSLNPGSDSASTWAPHLPGLKRVRMQRTYSTTLVPASNISVLMQWVTPQGTL